jgi:predicted dehydrogenase
MAPIRIGFIGLSSTKSWSVWAHLPYLKDSTKYEIVALCNSSLESAKAAVKAHDLPSTTKTYGSPEDLAADPDVELVVVSTRVDKHYSGILPALKAGKDVYTEWPLTVNTTEATELATLAKEKGVRTLIGLQGSQSPMLNKLKSLIADGKIGKPLSSTFHATPKFFGKTEFESLAYSHDIKNGGFLLSIYALHSLESISHVLGPLESYTPLLANSYTETQLTDFTGTVTKTIPRTSHDQVLLHGTFASGAVLSYHLRGGRAFADSDTAGVIWRIYGTDGEIQVTGPDSFIHIADDNCKIEVFEHASKKTSVVEVDKDAYSEGALYARNVSRLYEAFADGKGKEDGVLGFDEAVERHQFIDEAYKKAGVTI